MRKIIDLLRDMLLAAAIGLGIGFGLILVFGCIGALFGGFGGALEASRGAVLVAGGLLLLYAGITMLKGGNLPPAAFSLQPWKKQDTEDLRSTEPLTLFRRLPRQYVSALIAFGILTTSLIPESIVLYLL